jgi:15-cis-phytoene synthase
VNNRVTLAQSYVYCERVARRQAANFYPAFRVLPRPQRRAMCALYAFLRLTDDIADGPGDAAEKQAQLSAWRAGLLAALREEDLHRVHPALRDTVQGFAIPAWYLEAVIDGVEIDLRPVSFRRFAELYRYCFLVASTVGLACIHVWGFRDRAAKVYAEHAGIAFQLTNIIRDLPEDLARDRVYIPAEDFALFGCEARDLPEVRRSERVRDLIRYEVERARLYYKSAERLYPLLDRTGRAVFQVLMRTYRGLLDEIERRKCDVFSRRVSIGRWRKVGLVLGAVPTRLGIGRRS